MVKLIKTDPATHPQIGDIVCLGSGRFVRVLEKKATTVNWGESKSEGKKEEGKERKGKAAAFAYRVALYSGEGEPWGLLQACVKVSGRESYGFAGGGIVTKEEADKELRRREGR
jgi:hypothetical protein